MRRLKNVCWNAKTERHKVAIAEGKYHEAIIAKGKYRAANITK